MKYLGDTNIYLEIILGQKNKEACKSLVVSIAQQHGLDFDDSYQCAVSKEFDLKIVTQDNDFEKVSAVFNIELMA